MDQVKHVVDVALLGVRESLDQHLESHPQYLHDVFPELRLPVLDPSHQVEGGLALLQTLLVQVQVLTGLGDDHLVHEHVL